MGSVLELVLGDGDAFELVVIFLGSDVSESAPSAPDFE